MLDEDGQPFTKLTYIAALADLHIGEWRRRYSTLRFGYAVHDGTQWELVFEYSNGHKPVRFDVITRIRIISRDSRCYLASTLLKRKRISKVVPRGENSVMMCENAAKELKTWGGGSTFSYQGNVATGTAITYGKSNAVVKITKEQFEQLLTAFRGKSVKAGTSRDMAPAGSLGHWLLKMCLKDVPDTCL